MTLEDWLSSGWLKRHSTSRPEIADLPAKVDRAIAYNACLGCATTALRASGYRILGGAGQHYRTIQSLRFTVNPPPEIIASLEAISRKRAIVSYDAAGTITVSELSEAMSLAGDLREKLLSWLPEEHPELMQE